MKLLTLRNNRVKDELQQLNSQKALYSKFSDVATVVLGDDEAWRISVAPEYRWLTERITISGDQEITVLSGSREDGDCSGKSMNRVLRNRDFTEAVIRVKVMSFNPEPVAIFFKNSGVD